MCKFFSLVSNGAGKIYYFDWTVREQILKGKLDYEHDSHSSIADYFGLNEDKCNKWEYNVFTKGLTEDQINTKDDTRRVSDSVKAINFKDVIPQLNVKSIFHPFNDRDRKRITKKDILNLKNWDSVGDSVGDSVWDSVWDSV